MGKMLLLVIIIAIFILLKGLAISLWRSDKHRVLIVWYAANPWLIRFVITSLLLLFVVKNKSDIYFQIVRVAVFVTSGLCAIRLFDKTISLSFSLAVFIALAFNPFLKVEYQCLSYNEFNYNIGYWPIVFAFIACAFTTYKCIKQSDPSA